MYGNAIKNGGDNVNSYTTTPGTQTLTAFVRHDDNPIIGPHIVTDNGLIPNNVVLVWQDSPGLITHVGFTPDSLNLKFEVEQATIAQGNAILAVRDGNTILWSWHIWVTPLVNADAPATDRTLNNTNYYYDFMQYNLGWCTAKSVTYGSAPRSVMVRISQPTASGSEIFTITQTQGITVTTGDNAPFWQWGRKDPMPPSIGMGNGNIADKMIFNNNYPYTLTSGQITAGGAIQTPYTFYRGSNDWCSPGQYYNMWSANNKANTQSDNIVVKTVYDPAPVGFTMPATNAWTGLSTIPTFNLGWNVNLYGSGTTFFQASGFRRGNDGLVGAFGGTGVYWSAIPNSNNNANTLLLNSGGFGINNSARPAGCSIRCVLE